MSVPATMISFASAYRQLRPSEKAYVDAYVLDIERTANRHGERISLALYRPIPPAVVEASQGMLTRPMVCAAITERINEIAAANELTVHRVLKELMAVGFSSIGDYMMVGDDGQPMFNLANATPEQLSAVKSIEVEEGARGRKFKFTLHDKLAGLDKLARFMGMLETDNPHWRAETARPVGQAALPAGTTEEAAADLYARAIND